MDGLHSRDSGDGSDRAKLRVVARQRAFVHDVRGPLAYGNAGSAEPLQFGNAAGVIEMGVRVYDELDVFDAKSQRADAGAVSGSDSGSAPSMRIWPPSEVTRMELRPCVPT